MVPHLVYSDCMLEDQDEESTQALRFPNFIRIVLQVPISGHWLMFLGAGEKLLCFTKACPPSIVYLMSCALDFV